MIEILVRIGDIQICKDPGFYLATYGLSTCIAITMYDLASKTAGMAHVALPDSSINVDKSLNKPGYFADTAIPELCSQMRRYGASFSKNNTVVRIFGGRKTNFDKTVFNIGYKNVQAIKELIHKHQIAVKEVDVGGDYNRTVLVDVSTGNVTVKKFID